MSLLGDISGLVEALRGEMTPKFLATRSASGVPNVVPVISILPSDEEPDTLFFGNFLLRKSVCNLDEDRRVGVLVVTQALQGWVLRGDFIEWQRTGPYVERQMNSGLLRYNAYTGIRNAGVIRVRSVEHAFSIGKLEVLRDYLLARLASRGPITSSGDAAHAVDIPLPVQQEFARMAAVKVLAWTGGDGDLVVVPALSLQPAAAGMMICRMGRPDLPTPATGTMVASNVLTSDAVSYQAKGSWQQTGNTGIMAVQEIYAGGPPLPGHRIR